MALPASLLQHVEQHSCFSGCFGSEHTIQVCLDPARPLQALISVSCLDCLARFGAPTAILPAGSTTSSLASQLSQHQRTQRGFALAVSGYHAVGPGFWVTAVYYPCGLWLINGERSRPLGSDLDQLLLAMQHGVFVPPDPRMTDPKQYAIETVYVNFTQYKAAVRNKADFLTSPQCKTTQQPGWKKVTLAEFLPVARATPAPAAPASGSRLQAATAASKPVAAAPPKVLKVGDICPKCGAEYRDRPLLNGRFVGCMC